MTRKKELRYRDAPWYVKAWRWRFLLPVPFKATFWTLSGILRGGDRLPFRVNYSIARGLADVKMGRYVTSGELFAKLRAKRGN